MKGLRVDYEFNELPKEKAKRSVSSITFFVFTSLLVHALLVYALVSINMTLPESVHEQKVQVIKSYLYKAPKKHRQKSITLQEVASIPVESEPEIILKKLEEKIKPEPIKIVEEDVVKNKIKAPEIKKETKKRIEKQPNKADSTIVRSSPTQLIAPPLPSLQSKPKQAFSVQSHLSKLRNTIDNQIVAEEMQQLQAVRSASVMHKAQKPVPHTFVPLTTEQKIEKNTIRMDGSISIIKGDDGTCTIIREAFPGSPVPASVSSFSCGESKFDKSFREHMARVRAKTMSITNSKKIKP